MTTRRLRPLGVVPLAISGVAALGVSATIAAASATGLKAVPAGVKLLDTEMWGMGGSGTPIPSPELLEAVHQRYVDPATPLFSGQPAFPVDKLNALFTPEGLYPTTGVKSLELDPSLMQGVSILNSTITDQIAAGNNLVVVGGSQSSGIASLEMRDLLALPTTEQPSADQLSFVLLVDPNNPDGGLLERFGDPSLPALTVPSLGITFNGATPADTPWDTAIYDQEYDGFSDFPRYPIDLLADINAALGIIFVHGSLVGFTDAQIATAVTLPVSADYTGHTDYFMLPTQNLPLLDPLRFIPIVGNPLADLLQPDLTVLVNLGYGSITDGWDQGPANVPTPFGLFGTNIDPAAVLTALANGTAQGVQNFVHDLGSLSLPSLSEAFTTGAGGGDSLSSLTGIANELSSALANAYSALLPIADVATALTTTMPAYDVSLFVQELTSGHLLDAIGMPIAADLGIAPIAALFATAPVVEAFMGTS